MDDETRNILKKTNKIKMNIWCNAEFVRDCIYSTGSKRCKYNNGVRCESVVATINKMALYLKEQNLKIVSDKD